MESTKASQSILTTLSPIEAKDENDKKYEKCYTMVQNLISSLSEKEAHDALTAAVCKGPQNHEDYSIGLLVSILIEPANAARYYRALAYVTRDCLQLVMDTLTFIIMEKFNKLHDACRQQVLWTVKEMIKTSVSNTDILCFNLLRQVAGGDISPKNVSLAESLLDIFVENKSWLEKSSVLVATSVYTYLRLIVDHSNQVLTSLASLRQREVDFCITLLREKFEECMKIGRDLVRVLQNVARIPEFEKLWREIYYNPSSLSPKFTGILQLLTTRTSRRYLQCRLTPDMEKKILFLTSQVKFGQQRRHQEWFQKQYLSTPESQSLRCDLIRYICCFIHPSNEFLCSDIIPRWAVIGWLLTTCTSNVAASNAKLSLFYDWFFYDPERDNIMNIEPAILVMYHSMRTHLAITATLLDFLCRIMPNFFVGLTSQVKNGIYTSLRQILEKGVLQSLSTLFDNPKLDKELRAMIKESFTEFCSTVDAKPEDPLVGREQSKPFVENSNHVSVVVSSNNNANNSIENEAQFSEDEDDIPLGKLRIREVKYQPVNEFSKSETSELTECIEQLNGDIKEKTLSLHNETDNEARCELMEKLLQAVLQEEAFDQDVASSLGLCLAHILCNEFKKKVFPAEVDDESIEDSIGTPLFVMFRNLCQTPEEDPSRQPLLMIMTEIASHQPELGYLLLYFLKASKVQDDKMSSYKDYVKTLESKELGMALLSDLKMCQEDDVRLFCYLIPDIYIQFPNIAIGNAELLNLIVSCIDATQLQDLICHIMQGKLIMFRKDSFLSVLNASLEWETFEQFCLWQLIMAHNIPVDYVLPLLPKLDFQGHAEALISILLLLKQVSPTEDLLRHLMCREVKPNDRFVVSVLKYWCQEHEERLAEMIGSQLSKSATQNKRKRPQNVKSQTPSLEQTLSHLDHLRQCLQNGAVQTTKQPPLFSQEVIQLALVQAQSSCTEAQKSRYSDLFALAEDLEEVKPPKTQGRAGRTKGGTAAKHKTKHTITDSDSFSESSEEDEVVKPKTARKKKKITPVGSDSD